MRKEMGISTVKSIVEKRKVDWLKNIIRKCNDNVMLRAALTGDLALDPMGNTKITPWMAEMAEILTKLYCRNGLVSNIHEKNVSTQSMDWVWNETDIFQTRTETLLEAKDVKELNHHTEEGDERTNSLRTDPPSTGGEPRGTARTEHKDTEKDKKNINRFVISNICPLCRTVLADNRTAIQHVRITHKRFGEKGTKHCVTKKLAKELRTI